MTEAERPVDDTVFTWPHLLVRHVVVALGTAAVVLGLGVAVQRTVARPREPERHAGAGEGTVVLRGAAGVALTLRSRSSPASSFRPVPCSSSCSCRTSTATPTRERSHRKVAITLFSIAARDRSGPDGHRRVLPRSRLEVHRPVDPLVHRVLGATMDETSRRDFLRNGWKVGGALLIGAAAYTGYEAFRPLAIGRRWREDHRRARRRAFPTNSSTYVPAGRMYVVNADDYIFALSQKCPHLGCHVPYCESSGRFECPCHGSIYDLAGEYIAGPAPRGMDRYEVNARCRSRRRRHRGARTPARRGERSTSSRRPRAQAASGRPDMPREAPAAAALRTRMARSQPRSLPRVGPRVHGAAARRFRRVPGARAEPAQATRREPRPRATPNIGRELFAANCAQCHGKRREPAAAAHRRSTRASS